MKIEKNGNQLIFFFEGEMDHHQISLLKDIRVEDIEKTHPEKVILDFKHVSFVDSTGIGFVLARYKQLNAYRGELTLRNLSHQQHALFAMSGLFQLVREEGEAYE